MKLLPAPRRPKGVASELPRLAGKPTHPEPRPDVPLVLEPRVPPRHNPQPQLPLLPPERRLDPLVVPPRAPRLPRLRMHPIDHEVNVLLRPVRVLGHQRLVSPKPEIREQSAAAERARERAARAEELREEALAHPITRALIDDFGARIERVTTRADGDASGRS